MIPKSHSPAENGRTTQKATGASNENQERKATTMKVVFKKAFSMFVVIAMMLAMVPFGMTASAANAQGDMLIADNSTHHQWHDNLEHSTKEIGRIWTDKTVWAVDTVYPYEHQMPGALGVSKGSSDLLIELSALSSAATVTGTVTMSVPLDIILVMDTSGSMAEYMPSGEYTTVASAQATVDYSDLYSYQQSNGTLFFKIGNSYVPLTVQRSGNMGNRRYTISYTAPNSTTPTYIANNQRDGSVVLSYDVCTPETITRLQALKNAVNAFIDQTKQANDLLAEGTAKHRIGLVQFADDANEIIGLTYADNAVNVNTLKRGVNGLRANGATRADYGMEEAESILIGNNAEARDGAQKVVVFFTDGTPTTYRDFSASVANAAISSARVLKSEKTIVYTIGVFEQANPADTSVNFNQYMHGVSSNYPSATAYTSLGSRTDGSNYYLSATDAISLNNVFSGILTEVTSIKANASTQVEEGNEDTSGYITFVDPLGKYMKVDDFKAISFAERNYTNPTVTTNGNITTYTFQGANAQNPIYPTTGNLNQIIITVEKSDTLSVGDIVTVKIPGALIPIHYYEVDIDENGKITMLEDETLPIRIWYGVSVKEEAKAALENPDAELAAYMAANKDANGNVMFYSNLYKAGEENVYSTFEPNQKNNFYFFQNDEYLFTDAACTQPATSINANTTYYYQRDYYNPAANPTFANEAQKLTNTTAIPGSSNTMLQGYAKQGENGQYYIPKGAPRTTSITGYSVAKTAVSAGATNRTGTSAYAIHPAWIDVMENPTTVKNELGNNGIVKLGLPGTLAVTKLVTANDGLSIPADKEFTFKIELTAPQGEALQSVYHAQIFAEDGTKVGNAFDFSPTTGNTVVLKADQTVYIYGLAAGTQYSISETNMPEGFDKTGAATEEGAISSGATSFVRVTNNYSVDSITFTAADLGLIGTKILQGRNFVSSDVFEFMVAATVFSPDAPLPSKATNGKITVTADQGNSKDFDIGDFTFTKPGEYHYEIREIIPAANKLPGVSYDSTVYRVVITIADDGAGAMTFQSIEIDKNNPASSVWNPVYSGNTLPGAGSRYITFTNVYTEQTESIVLRGTKTLNGKNLFDYSANPFMFEIKAAGSRGYGSQDDFTADAGQPMPATTTVPALSTGDIVFPDMEFTGASAGKEYKYIITEVLPAGAVEQGGKWVYNGVTYDRSEKEVFIRVTNVDIGGTNVVFPEVTGNQFAFVNEYKSEPASYEIQGQKNLTGRNFRNGDTFKFEIEAVGDAPKPVDGNNNPVTVVTITPSANNSANFSFGTVRFNQDNLADGAQNNGERTKTFTYKLREVALNAAGMVYDTVERTLTIAVKDSQGKTQITAVKLDGAAYNAPVVWSNTYNASVVYGGMNVIKELEGKAIAKDEFSFTLTAQAGTPALPQEESLFSIPFDVYYNPATNHATAAMAKLAGITFTQADAGKTFTYIAQEVIPQTTGNVTYDKSQYQIALKPYDNGDGTMGVQTVITQIVDAQGQTVANGASTVFDSKDAATASIVFKNKYAVQGGVLEGATNLNVIKSFVGRDWTAADEFKFQIELEGNVPSGAVIMPAETVITITKDTANHSKAFGDIRFTQAGTYTFVIKEQIPQGGKKDGVTYDNNASKVVVDVANTGTGALTATVQSADTLTFVNVYAVETGTSTVIEGTKVLNNKDLVDDAFTFELYQANENFVVSGDPVTKTNQNGGFTFDLTYAPTDAGKTFYYVLREKNFGKKIDGITYDSAEYHITVQITDDGVGGATAVKTIVKGTTQVQEVQFTNTYTPDKPVTPDTGDNRNLILWMTLLIVSGFGFAATNILLKKEETEANK